MGSYPDTIESGEGSKVRHGIGGLPQPGKLKSVVPRPCTKLGDDFTVALALSENGLPGYPQKQ